MKHIKKMCTRLAMVLLVMALAVSMVPFQASAAEGSANVITDEAGNALLTISFSISESDGTGTWDASAGTYTATASGQYSKNTNTVTIKNSGSKAAKITYTATVSGGVNSCSLGIKSGSVDGELTLPSGGTSTITIQNKAAYISTNTATLVLSNITYEPIEAKATVTFTHDASLGSVAVSGGSAIAPNTPTELDLGATVVATPASGASFVGWIDPATNAILSTSSSWTVPMEGVTSVSVYPVFISGTDAWFNVNDAYLIQGLNEANAKAAGSGKIVLMNNATLPAGDYTVSSGVTLLIPYDAAHTLNTTQPTLRTVDSDNKWSDPVAYRTLTMVDGAKLTVNGALSLSSKVGSANGGQIGGGAPIDSTSMIKMQGSSSITVNGTLYAWGYITGSGSVTVKSGATAYECFQVHDFRGGTETSGMANRTVFPLSQYYVQNVEVPMTVEAGATEYGFCSLRMSILSFSNDYPTTAKFIGSSEAMFSLKSGSITKRYDGATDRMVVAVNGELEMQNLSLKVATTSIDSKNYELPVNSNITLQVNKGSKITVKQDLALLPGVQISIAEGAEFKLASGYNIYVYDGDQWGKFVGAGAVQFVAAKYAPGRTYTRTASDLKDASILVNGTVDASEGYIYTTESGANIHSSGNGVVKTKAGTQTVTYQHVQGADGDTEIAITPAQLKHADGTYLTTASGAYAYDSAKGIWGDYCTVKGHTMTPATCESPATCSVCGHTEGDPLGHSMQQTAPAVAPDCENPGTTAVLTCANNCGKTEGGTTVNALGHDMQETEAAVAPKCEEEGKTAVTVCSRCAHTEGGETVKALGHDMQETEAAVAPKCEEEGKTAVLTCANGCGKTEGGDPVDELGHDMQKSADAVAATCEAPGKTEVKTCANGCGKTEGGEPVDALGHDMQKTADAVAATCENPGTTAVYTCSRGCGHQTGGETVDALGHTSGDPERTNVVEAKCGVPGSYDMVQKCTACGAVTNTVSHEIPALEHILEMTQEAVSPDCENPGTTAVYTCSRGCGYSEGGETLKALGHDMQETEAAVAPKCEEEGKTAVLTCANGCGKTEGGETVEATGHKNTIVVNAKDATCGEAGYTGDTYCNDCQKTVKNGETIDATGDHSYDDGVYTDPTFEADGYTTYTCGVCKGTKVDTDEGSMLTAVAQIGEQKFQTLAAAIEAAAANEAAETIELLSKAVITEDTTWDLGEDTLSFFAESGENYGLVIKAHLTVNGGAYVTNSLFGIGVNPNGTLTVNGGEFRCAGDSDYLIGSWGTTAINGGTFNGQYNCVNAFEGTLTVTGGTFSTAETDYSGEYESADILGDGKVTVTGGTYSKEVDASFLAEGYCVAEAEGKYDVAKHSYNEKVTDPTCTADGYTTYTCQRCGDTYDVTDEGSMIAHSFTNYVSNKDATCTADGTKTAKCDNCDATDTVTDADSKLDHPTTEVRDAKNATCTEEGYTGDTWCTTCNTKIADGTATDKAPHTEETVPAVPATCMAPGATAGVKCTVCLEILSGCEETAQLEHEDTDSDHICNNGCNAKISECDFTVCGEVVTEANCVTEAVYKAVCSVCGAVSETETITGEVDSAKHTGNTEVRDAKDATCVAEGYTGDTWCKDCNTKTATGEAIEKLTTHSYPDTWTEVQAPTCTEKGSEKRECTVEGCDSFETREIAATGEHVDSDGDNKCDGCGMDIGEEEPDVSAKPQVTAKSLLLEGMVSVKVYLGFTDADGQNFDINYVLEHGGLEVTCVDGTVVDCNELKKSSIYAGIQEYTAETPGIPAKDMDKALILRPYIVIDGEKVYGEATEYGVLNYAENMIQKSTTNAETKATIVGLLKYGAAAQKYFDNQKNNSYVAPEILMDACLDTFVANGWLGADVLELNWNAEWITAVVEPEAEMTVNFVQKDSSIRCTGKSLLLNGAISINYYMSVGEDSTNFEGCSATLYQWTGADYQKLQNSGEILTKNNATYTTTVTPKFTYTSGYGWECKVASEQIPAKEFGDTFYAVMCFTDKDGNEHYTNVVVYSPEAYANSKLNSSDSTLVELVKWMVAYGERARIKFGN